MKLRLVSPGSLIDINRLADLNYIRERNGKLEIGALTRHDQLATSSLVREKCPLLAEAAASVADQQVRNRGSIGGSLAHADPSADLPTACTALNAEIKITSRNGSRTIAANDFFLDLFTTVLSEDEMIQEISVPVQPRRSGGAYKKLTRGHNDFALVSVAAQLSLNPDNTCQTISVAIGGVGSKPMRASETERALTNQLVDEGWIREASFKAAEGLKPSPDPRVSQETKLRLAEKLTEVTLRVAFNRACGAV
jgi:carbon-monoxide dehydrogenase medium subunit